MRFLHAGAKHAHLDPLSVTRAIRSIRDQAGANDIHLHDARAACRSWLKGIGVDSSVLDAILGHTGASVGDRHYNAPSAEFINSRVRPALQAWANHVSALVDGAAVGDMATRPK